MITASEAFMLGFKFAQRIRDCYDSRDVGRVLICEDFPIPVQGLSNSLNGFLRKEQGVAEAILLIRKLLDEQEMRDA